MPKPLTQPQHDLIISQAIRAFSKFSHADDLLGMIRNMGFGEKSVSELTTQEASKIIARLAELNDPNRRVITPNPRKSHDSTYTQRRAFNAANKRAFSL